MKERTHECGGHARSAGWGQPSRSHRLRLLRRAGSLRRVRPNVTLRVEGSGPRGRCDLTFEQQVDLDHVGRIWPALEIAIVFETVPAVISGRGAY